MADNFIYGVQGHLELTNVPCGTLKVKIRQRPDDFVMCYLKFENRVEQWVLSFIEEATNKVKLEILIGVNQKTTF